ncbi:hypothetical protein P22_0596 [Propionispora sp. 2/2-37]|uniref:tetraacyldisaccharide 4'-kinase n=1 Tax=Propionispora sp. 2/2-37 TaxID=1677858 RepID=UPI0006BB8D9C|nr:tetraacyldisaccharide 4'-kinase [Propionispora sp. 2/2-37]CUH94530.1 hypothetical protein P22_0596 [Propionispora sp. 2/2-37]
MHFLYNILGLLLVLAATPVFIFRTVREKGFGERLRQSMGILPSEEINKVAHKDCIWVHAASVGEIVAASPIVKEFHREMPDSPILVSVVTSSGYEMARRIVKDATAIIYFPLDLPWISRSVVTRIQPKVFVPVETELWPEFLKTMRENQIPVMMANGRISDKSVVRYRYLLGILRDMMGTVGRFCMQSAVDADYIIRLGANPARVIITGNTKYDQTYTAVSAEEKEKLFREMGLAGSSPIVVAGSTHRGEEEPLFTAFAGIREEFPAAKLIIAPRDTIRTQEIIDLAVQYGLQAAQRTVLKEQPGIGHDVVLVDTIGELGKIYGIGDIVYVGGSLVPRGGHNILEPAAHGKPILTGPHMFNFKDTYALFSEREACVTVKNAEELQQSMLQLLKDEGLREDMSRRSLAIIEENQGAARKSALHLRDLLEDARKKKETGKAAAFSRETSQLYLYSYFYKLIHGEKQGPLADVLLSVLRFLSFIYGLGVDVKLALYRYNLLKRHKLPCQVISLGNITVGGTGKTPTAQRLAAIIRDSGHRVVILNRGYRAQYKGKIGLVSDGSKIYMSAAEAGDEAFLLAKNLPGVPVLIGKDRAITGNYAVQHFQAEVIIMDDGYQHWQLERDLDIVLIDTINVFGNNFLLPRGTLREPLENLDRAQAILLTKADQSTEDARSSIRDVVRHYNPHALVVESLHSPRCFIEVEEWYKGDVYKNMEPLETVRGKKVMALSAIGNPSSFEQTIVDIGAEVVYSARYPDHHSYTMVEMQQVMQRAVENGVYAVITTGKDAVKIPAEFIHSQRPLPIYMLDIELRFTEGYPEMMELINRVADQQTTPAFVQGETVTD